MARRTPEPLSGQTSLFTSLFEEDFLLRTLGDLVRVPDVALGELVANAWDLVGCEVAAVVHPPGPQRQE